MFDCFFWDIWRDVYVNERKLIEVPSMFISVGGAVMSDRPASISTYYS